MTRALYDAEQIPLIDFRYGRYQDVLQDVVVDVLLADPPYSDRTHEGRRTGSDIRTSGITYDSITEQQRMFA